LTSIKPGCVQGVNERVSEIVLSTNNP